MHISREGTLDYTNQSAILYNESIHKYLQDICKPLFENFGITIFEYVKIFFDSTCLNISTNHKWLIHNYTKCPMGTVLEKHLKTVPIGSTRYLLFGIREEDLRNPMLREAHKFNIWNGLNIYKRYTEECECFLFATHPHNTSILEFYMNERILLEKFIHYFKEKAQPFIDSFDMRKRTVFVNDSSILSSTQTRDHSIEKCALAIKPNKYFITKGKTNISLSKREMQCLCLFAYGKSVKEIALSIDLSPRTVESYINSVKQKTSLTYKSDLINLFHENIGTKE